MIEPKEYCRRCKKVTPSKLIRHAACTEYRCGVCGYWIDLECDDYEDDDDPTGSRELCGTNLYMDEGPLCDQCEWSLGMVASRSDEDLPY